MTVCNKLPGFLTTIDIHAVSVVILHRSVMVTVAIAAFTVMVMKGPACGRLSRHA